MTFIAGYIDSNSVSLLSDSVVSFNFKQNNYYNRSFTGEDINRYQNTDAYKFIHIDNYSVATFTSKNCSVVSDFFDELLDRWKSEKSKKNLIEEVLRNHSFDTTVFLFAISNEEGIPSILVADNRNYSNTTKEFIVEWLSYDEHFVTYGSIPEGSKFEEQSHSIFEKTDEIRFTNDIDRMAVNVGLHQVAALDSSIIQYDAGGIIAGCNLSSSGITYLPIVVYNAFELKKNKKGEVKMARNLLKVFCTKFGATLFSSMNNRKNGRFDEYFEYSDLPESNINMLDSDRNKLTKRIKRRQLFNVAEGRHHIKHDNAAYYFNFLIGDINSKFSLSGLNLLVVSNEFSQKFVNVSKYNESERYFDITFDNEKLSLMFIGSLESQFSLTLESFNIEEE